MDCVPIPFLLRFDRRLETPALDEIAPAAKPCRPARAAAAPVTYSSETREDVAAPPFEPAEPHRKSRRNTPRTLAYLQLLVVSSHHLQLDVFSRDLHLFIGNYLVSSVKSEF